MTCPECQFQNRKGTLACGRCGDSFFGSPSAGRSWLLAHHSEEHRQRPQAPVQPRQEPEQIALVDPSGLEETVHAVRERDAGLAHHALAVPPQEPEDRRLEDFRPGFRPVDRERRRELLAR